MIIRRRAAVLATDLAQRLTDPRQVREWLPDTDASRRYPGQELSLSDGMPGIALLHLERGRDDERALRTAHHWLSGAVTRAAHHTARGLPGLYRGVPALSFALSRAELATGRPVPAAHRLAGHVRTVARALAGGERCREPAAGECATIGTYDVVSGLAGLGAHLLDGRQHGIDGSDEALADVLTALTRLTAPVEHNGRTLPGWWTAQYTAGHAPATVETGHANVGLAHGAPGPLALLALAWQDGAAVPGQREAIGALAEWLTGIQRGGPDGTWWPRTMVLDPCGTVVPGERAPGRPSWCYGTAGIARALYLAGRALDVRAWRESAVAAWHGALARARRDYDGPETLRLTDAGLCHGWAGVLQATWRMADDTGDPALRAYLPWLAERVLDLADIDEPFGLVPPRPVGGLTGDPAGFLTGAAGVALALHTFATDAAPATRWDRALLLA
ncbi:lanthionine synthetase C family protein [Streptomyces gamaensis]|uniref:Lanthionine synthetase C family protein n=1 Tax=Streptomyces gamaensis TaxID=1763542 RepID=A0ABW0Z1L8_9ACTN